MKLIISGVPCSGKTSFGDWLRDERAFAHVNLERRKSPLRVTPPKLSSDLPDWLGSLAEDVVVTWGFRPEQDALDLIARFRAAGFTPWWFRADPAIARARYIERAATDATVAFFDFQMADITHAKPMIDAIYEGYTVETLSAAGYKSPEKIYEVMAANADNGVMQPRYA